MPEELFFDIILLLIIMGTPFCGGQKCVYENSAYLCQNLVNKFPSSQVQSDSYQRSNHIICENCHIEKFTSATFPNENNFINVNFSCSGIRMIGKKSFTNFHKLYYLHLEDNNITEISSDAFLGLNQLLELHLEVNKLTSLTDGFLNDVSSQLVNISGNMLETLSENAFVGSNEIYQLDLSKNSLKKLEKNVFESMKDLEQLNLSFNSLCFLPLGIFKSLQYLLMLNLSHNQLSRLSYGIFTGLSRLNVLNLASNQFEILDSGVFLPLYHLHKLDISKNEIDKLEVDKIYSNVPTLKRISLEENIYSCSSLETILRFLKEKNIDLVINDPSFDYLNTNGIACLNYPITHYSKLSYSEFLDEVKKESIALSNQC